MSSPLVRAKIKKPSTATITPLEKRVAEAYVDLETHVTDLRADMKGLMFYSVTEIEAKNGRKVMIISVPAIQLRVYRKINTKLVRELEKKFSDKHVLLIARRKIIPKPQKNSGIKLKRTRKQTLTAVHEAMLDDLVYPCDIIGKRLRYKKDGTNVLKVHLNPKDRTNVEYKLDSFVSAYRKLTGKRIAFEFPTNILE
jgi:small subunit ribosomal protein S7e